MQQKQCTVGYHAHTDLPCYVIFVKVHVHFMLGCGRGADMSFGAAPQASALAWPWLTGSRTHAQQSPDQPPHPKLTQMLMQHAAHAHPRIKLCMLMQMHIDGHPWTRRELERDGVWGSQWHVRASVAIRPAQPEGCKALTPWAPCCPTPLSRRAAMADLGATAPAAAGPAGADAGAAGAFTPLIPVQPAGHPAAVPGGVDRHPIIADILTVTLDINDGIRALLASGDRMGHRMMIQGAEHNLRAALTTLQGIRDAIAEVQPGQPAQPGQQAALAQQPALGSPGTQLLPPPPPGPPPAGAAGPKAPPPGVAPGMAGIPAHLQVKAPPAQPQPVQPVQPQESLWAAIFRTSQCSHFRLMLGLTQI